MSCLTLLIIFNDPNFTQFTAELFQPAELAFTFEIILTLSQLQMTSLEPNAFRIDFQRFFTPKSILSRKFSLLNESSVRMLL